MMIPHGGVNGGRSHSVEAAGGIRGTADRDRAIVRGSQGTDGELMGPSVTAGTRVPED